jgi:hypothetical protein
MIIKEKIELLKAKFNIYYAQDVSWTTAVNYFIERKSNSGNTKTFSDTIMDVFNIIEQRVEILTFVPEIAGEINNKCLSRGLSAAFFYLSIEHFTQLMSKNKRPVLIKIYAVEKEIFKNFYQPMQEFGFIRHPKTSHVYGNLPELDIDVSDIKQLI